MYEYRPQLQKIIYRPSIPGTIARTAERVGPTRFFGSFSQNDKTYAVHFYDKSRVRPTQGSTNNQKLERDSCLDIFQITANKKWERIQTFAFTRLTNDNRDRLTVEAQTLWLDPNRKKTPMIYLRIMENVNREAIPTGTRTDIYGVLLDKNDPKTFLAVHGYVPYSHTTITLSEISFPDPNDHLTILSITSNPGDTSYTAYGWSGKSWKVVGQADFENGLETALRWNGSQFVPLTQLVTDSVNNLSNTF